MVNKRVYKHLLMCIAWLLAVQTTAVAQRQTPTKPVVKKNTTQNPARNSSRPPQNSKATPQKKTVSKPKTIKKPVVKSGTQSRAPLPPKAAKTVPATPAVNKPQDTVKKEESLMIPQSKMLSNLVKQGLEAITRDSVHVEDQAAVINAKSASAYMKYQGRIIRNIFIHRLNFDQKITDTNSRLAGLGARLMDATHVNTKEWAIKENLFIKVGEPMNAYKVADNERYLRTLNFIQDARIVVYPVFRHDDSVDIEVFTKDLYSISANGNIVSPQQGNIAISDANLMGTGQSLEARLLYDQRRAPSFGWGVYYGKNSIGGSFINATAGYTVFNPSMHDGRMEEHTYFIDMERPLVSAYSYMAGGLFFGEKFTMNHYGKPEALYYKYSNKTFDLWSGVNIGCRKLMAGKGGRDRHFFGLRYLNSKFDETPYQIGNAYNMQFNDMTAVLGQLTFFRQDFYKTNYIYGFGLTEDIPYGYKLSLIGGWTRQIDLVRPYAGIRGDRFIINNQGDFFHHFARVGGFINNRNIEDVSVLAGSSVYLRLLYAGNFKFRNYFSLSYARLFNKIANEWLRINNPYGLRDYTYRFLDGYQRLNAHAETSMFLNCRLLGFKFAPFTSVNAALLTPQKAAFLKSDVYTGFGGGVRTRNENLIFGTIELRGTYFPRQVTGEPAVIVSLTTNMRYRYNTSYVSKPDFVNVNME